jgi:hypothetical protein
MYMHILSFGGEGIIVREPFALYPRGYSQEIYKYKVCSRKFSGDFANFWLEIQRWRGIGDSRNISRKMAL